MAYTPTVWKNGEFPPIDAEHLNKIEQGIADAVSVTPQTLSDEQKSQARGNINAAPGGFGLGGAAKVLTPADNLNDVWQAGWYAWDAAPQNAPTVGGSLIPYCSMTVLNKGGAYNTHQIIYTFEGYEIHRYYDGAKQTWSEWAWVNPPMIAGVEYRTTKYYLGNPVYVKTVDCGLPQTNTTWATPHGISGVKNFISATAQSGVYIANGIFKGSEGLGGDSMTIATDPTNIHISTYGYWSTSEHAIALLKYTKTTD